MTELRRGTSSPTPRARLDRVSPAVRHLWSLLYRATRRHAARVDQLGRFVTTVTTRHRLELDELHRRVTALEHDRWGTP